jgi:hypothetical protein
MLVAQKVAAALLFDSQWKDPETDLLWLHAQDCFTFADYCGWPDVVDCWGQRFVKTGWNSDTGRVYYRQATISDLVAQGVVAS